MHWGATTQRGRDSGLCITSGSPCTKGHLRLEAPARCADKSRLRLGGRADHSLPSRPCVIPQRVGRSRRLLTARVFVRPRSLCEFTELRTQELYLIISLSNCFKPVLSGLEVVKKKKINDLMNLKVKLALCKFLPWFHGPLDTDRAYSASNPSMF